MIKIIEKQKLSFGNILIYRTGVLREKLPYLLSFAEANIDAMDLNISGNMIFSVSDNNEDKQGHMIRVEIMIPVDRCFTSERYIFKPVFTLDNALSLTYSGSFSRLPEAENSLAEYMRNNKLSARTAVYYVVKRIVRDCGIIDVMVGVS